MRINRRAFLKNIGGTTAIAVSGVDGVSQSISPLPIFVANQLPRQWQKCFQKLFACESARKIPQERWRLILSGAQRLLLGHIVSLIEFGWTPVEVFAVDAIKPEARLDQAGVLYLLTDRPIVLLSEDRVSLRNKSGAITTIYRKPARSWEQDRLAMLWET